MTKRITHDDSLIFALCENVIELSSINAYYDLFMNADYLN